MDSTKEKNVFGNIWAYVVLFISMAGFVPKHATFLRTIIFASSLGFSVYLAISEPNNSAFAFTYFIVAEVLYIGFIMLVLARRGFRLWFKKRWSDGNEAYKVFEGMLGFLFFHNAVSLGYMASSTQTDTGLNTGSSIFLIVLGVIFITGFLIKILAAKVVTIDIYYWKDMFLGRKVSEFVVSGPYKYLSNPMYGFGQMQAYAAAIWYGSHYGLMAALLNQCLIFVFYYFFEKKFINRIYLNKV